MPRPAPLPPDIPPVFRVADALSRGVGESRLGRADLRTPFHGLRAAAALPDPATVEERAAHFAPRLRSWQFFSHDTALALVGAPLPEWPYRPEVHVSAHRPAREPRTTGVRGHRLQGRESAQRWDAGGLPIEHPVRAWRQAGTLWSCDDLIAAAEFLISGPEPLARFEDLREEVEIMGDVRRGVLARALAEVRAGARSPRETKLRLALTRAALPAPRINWPLRDDHGRFVAELDLAYTRWRIGVEYDGRVHETDRRQFAKDADRWDAIRAEGWEHVRILRHHMVGDASEAVHKVRTALVSAGWRPSI